MVLVYPLNSLLSWPSWPCSTWSLLQLSRCRWGWTCPGFLLAVTHHAICVSRIYRFPASHTLSAWPIVFFCLALGWPCSFFLFPTHTYTLLQPFLLLLLSFQVVVPLFRPLITRTKDLIIPRSPQSWLSTQLFHYSHTHSTLLFRKQ